MATFKFTKIYESMYCTEVEADSLAEAKAKVGDAEWYEDDKPMLSNSYVQEIDEYGDLGDDMEWKA